jgi:predicted RNA-binding Zn-ribbon protein involved in translation (DUF1610 family)
MVNLTDIACRNCGFEQMLLIGTSNFDQVYTDLNNDFNYYKVFYCPVHHVFANLEAFNQNLSQMQNRDYYIHNNTRCPADAGCTNAIELEDMVKFTQDFPCPKCGEASSLTIRNKEMLED